MHPRTEETFDNTAACIAYKGKQNKNAFKVYNIECNVVQRGRSQHYSFKKAV